MQGMGTHLIERFNMEITAFPAQNGAYTAYQAFACGPWRKDVPEFNGPVLLQFASGSLNVYKAEGGKFVTNNGYAVPLPERWAQVFLTEPTWTGDTWEDTPYVPPKEVPLMLYHEVKGLMAVFPWTLIMDAADMVVNGVPPKGEPE